MVKGKLSRNSKQGHSILLKTQISEPCHWPGMVLNKISFNFSSCLSTRLFGLLSKRTMLSCQMREGMAYYTFKKKNINIYIFKLINVLLDLSWGTWTLSGSVWDLVPWPGMEPSPPALGAWSFSHWTARRAPHTLSLLLKQPRHSSLNFGTRNGILFCVFRCPCISTHQF